MRRGAMKPVGAPILGNAIPAVLYGGNEPQAEIELSLVPVVLDPMGAASDGVALVLSRDPTYVLLRLDDAGARLLLAELLRHTRPTEVT